MHIYFDQNITELNRKAAFRIDSMFAKFKNQPVLFLTSGGSALQILNFIDTHNLSSQLTISVLDERFSKDPKFNNFLQLQGTKIYNTVVDYGCLFIETIPYDHESIDEFANRYESALKNWKIQNPNGKIVATLGIGRDGHTSGIMPFPENETFFTETFVNSDKWVIGYNVEGKNPISLRVTTTIKFLKEQIDYALIYMTGEDKREVLNTLLDKKMNIFEFPSMIIWQMKNVEMFTDINPESLS